MTTGPVASRLGQMPVSGSAPNSSRSLHICEIATEDGHVQGAHFATAKSTTRAAREEFAGGREVAAFDRLVQFLCGDAVDSGLELGPAFEAVRARE